MMKTIFGFALLMGLAGPALAADDLPHRQA